MRFGILAAAAALGMSAPVSAAALWTFKIDTTFQVRGVVSQFLCQEPTSACLPRTTIDENVPTSFLITIPEFSTFTSGGQRLNSFLGYGLDARVSYLVAALRWEGNNIAVDSARVEGANYGCSLGRPPCTDVVLNGPGVNYSISFVSSEGGPPPVPEPATWAMMIGGFGLVGGSMRYRRRRTRFHFA